MKRAFIGRVEEELCVGIMLCMRKHDFNFKKLELNSEDNLQFCRNFSNRMTTIHKFCFVLTQTYIERWVYVGRENLSGRYGK